MTAPDKTLVERLRYQYSNWGIGSKGPGILIDAADTIDRLTAEKAALAERLEAARGGETSEVLLFTSYCGNDNTTCSDARPCPTCLGMSNVFRIPRGALGQNLGSFEPRWFANKHIDALDARKIGKAPRRRFLEQKEQGNG